MTSAQYLDLVKRRLGISSDYGLIKALGVTQQTISKLRRGGTMSNTTAVKVAELLGLDALKVIADAELERGSSPELWKRMRDAAAWTAIAIGAASFGLAPGDAYAARFNNNLFAVNFPAAPVPAHTDSNTHCAASRRRRSLGAAIAALLAWLLAGVAL